MVDEWSGYTSFLSNGCHEADMLHSIVKYAVRLISDLQNGSIVRLICFVIYETSYNMCT